MSKNHVVYMDLSIVMEEMDGDPNESAEVLLDSVAMQQALDTLREAGYEIQFNNVWAEEMAD